MERKHAIVLALTFVLVGLIFFSVDTPLVNQHDVKPVIHKAPEIIEQLAAEPVPQEPLKMNVVSNPSFETWVMDDKFPEDWNVDATGYVNSSRTYTGSIKHDSYAGFAEAMGSNASYASTYLRNNPDESVIRPYLKYGVSLSLDWYTIANPDLLQWGQIYILVQVQNTTGSSQALYYYLSHLAGSWGNDTYNAYFLLNDTIGSWNTFDRNITADFIAAFGPSLMSDTHYVDLFTLYVSSPGQATGLVQVVCDDVSMYNSSFSNWILNGDFESGIGTYWTTYQKRNMGYLGKSIDSIEGSYSMNMSITTNVIAYGQVRVSKYFLDTNTFFAFGPGMNTISWDWKYHDVAGEGSSQWSFLQFAFYNGTNYFLEMYMGRGDDYMDGNSSTTARIRVPGFGTRDSWEHTELDLYDIMQEVGFIDLKISSILFETYYYGGILGERVEVLIDNFSMETHPLANPSFEYLDPYSTYDPFQGWWRYSSNGEVTPSTMMHSYSYSANITVAPFGAGTADGLYRSELYFEFDPSLFIDFWWRLEDIQSTSETCAWMDLEFINHLGGNSYLRYIVGRSSAYVISNTTNVKWIDANGFNQTSSWNQLYRNVTADIENAFSISADDWELYQVMTLVYADAGMRTSLLIDDFNYKDGVPPSIDSVTPPSSVMYYDTGYVRTVASDVRPGVARVVVNYTTDSWSTWHTTTGSYSTVNDWFNVFIPMQVYGTTVEFYVIAIDGGGLETIDDNGGSFYSYTVGDDVIPSVSFTTPSFFEEIEGQVSIVIEAVDSGSGVAFVELYIDSGVSMPLVMNDTVAPYEYTWNTDVEDLGTYTLYANVVDNAGLSNGAIVNVTVVDTLAPELNSPDDIEFTVGETGYTIDWDPTDVRPYGYVVHLDGAFYQFNNWNSSSEHIVIDLDGLAVGTYNFTCVVVDGTINGAIDTVFVTVNEAVVTTPTGASSTTSTTSGPTGGGDLMTPLLVVAIVGVVGILLVIFIVLPKMKKT